MLEEQIFVWKWTSIEDYDEEASVDGIEKVKYGKFYALLWPNVDQPLIWGSITKHATYRDEIVL